MLKSVDIPHVKVTIGIHHVDNIKAAKQTGLTGLEFIKLYRLVGFQPLKTIAAITYRCKRVFRVYKLVD